MVAPEIHQITVSSTTPTSISLTWNPPTLHEHLHARIIEYGIIHEPIDVARHGSSRMLRSIYSTIAIPSLDPATGHGFSIMCRSIAGWSKPSSKLIHFTSSFTPTTPPPLELLRVSINSLFVTWFPSEFDNGLRIDCYEIDIRPMTDSDEDQNDFKSHLKTHAELLAEGIGEMTLEEKLAAKAAKKAQFDKAKAGERLRRLIKHKDVADLQRTVIGLEPFMMYKLKVRAHNELGYSPWSQPLVNACAKDGVVVTEFGDEWADLAWFTPVLNHSMKREVTAYEGSRLQTLRGSILLLI